MASLGCRFARNDHTAAFLEDNMRLSFRTIVVSTLTLIVSSTLATAAEVRVLSVGSTQIAAKAIAAVTVFVKYLASAAAAAHWSGAKLEPAETYTRTRARQ